MTSPNPNYDQLLSTTLANYRNTLTDNVFSATPLVDRLKRSDRIRMVGGGVKIVEPLLHAQNTTAKPYSGWDVLDITPQEGISAAEFPWRQFAVSVAINGIEEAVNSGEAAFINLLETKLNQAEMSAVSVMNTMFHGDGANFGGTANAKTWNGLANLVGTTNTVGGIDGSQSANSFWRSVVLDATDTGVQSTAARNSHTWGTAYYSASNGADVPTFGLTTQTLYQSYEESLTAQLRFTSNDSADARFQNLLFKGVPLFWDSYCAAGVTYFLNEKYISLVGHSDKWMKNTDFRETPDVDGRWAQIISYGNLTIRNRARQAKITGQTA